MWQTYYQPTSLNQALLLLEQRGPEARIVSGGTDVLVELQRGVRPTSTLIDITALPGLKYVRVEDGVVAIGGLATHNDVLASVDGVRLALPLAQACWEVGAPQIRTRGTLAGNLVTASPANDTITPLLALDAEVALASAGGERVVALRDFYLGVRRTVIRPDELLREIRFPALRDNQRGIFLKLGLRRAQAISVINLAAVLTFDGPLVADARITLGCLAPTVVRATSAEAFLRGKQLEDGVCREAGRLACDDVRPIDDLRGSAAYRVATLANLLAEGLRRVAAGTEASGLPAAPVLLERQVEPRVPQPVGELSPRQQIQTTINGKPYQLPQTAGKSLLTALREEAGLTGTKEGCAEGECGACTVWLNGQAVMACLVPAPQAHGATITTIEGLGSTGPASVVQPERAAHMPSALPGARGEAPGMNPLHPLQRAFIECGAVQCGYCIPGMLMAGAKLLQEQPSPDLEQVRVALSGNICRCTGYRKILDAVLVAAGQMPASDASS